MREWISKLLQDAVSRTLAAFLGGFLIAVIVFAFSADFATFLRSEVTANVGLLLILALFGLIGLTAGISRLIVFLARYREVGTVRPRDENLEQSQRSLLEKLAKIETGPEIHYTNAMRDFRSELITHFDQWEGAVEPYISDTDKDRIREMRAHIQGQSLNHARDEGAEWTQTVKEITYTARLNVRPKH